MDVKNFQFKEKWPLLLVICFCLVKNYVNSVEVDVIGEGISGIDSEDLDYAAEEAAKEAILKNEKHNSAFSGNRLHGIVSQVMLENTPIWREFWNDWKEKKLTLRKSITDVKPLCKPSKNYKILVDCNSTKSAIPACIDAVTGIISKCNNSENSSYSVPVCMEISSRKVAACGKLTTAYLCVPDINGTNINGTFASIIAPIRPCHVKERQICLGRRGFMDLCHMMFNSSLQKSEAPTATPLKTKNKDTEIRIQYNNLTEWWKEWESSALESKSEEAGKNLSSLCQPEAEKEYLVRCEISSKLPKACIEARSGEIKQCLKIKKKDMPVAICVEKSSKVTSCEKDAIASLCYSKYKGVKSITPCHDKRRHICLNNGTVALCSQVNGTNLNSQSNNNTGSGRLKIPSKDFSKHNISFEIKNVTGRSKELSSKSMLEKNGQTGKQIKISDKDDNNRQTPICRSLQNRVVFCNSSLALSRLCINTVRSVIGNCKSFNTTEKPVPICVEDISKRIIICGEDLPPKYLCFEKILNEKSSSSRKKNSFFVFACLYEDKMRCLNTKGKLVFCAELNQKSEEAMRHRQKVPLRKNFLRSKRSLIKPNDFPILLEHLTTDNNILTAPTIYKLSEVDDNFSSSEERVLCLHKGKYDRLILCDDRSQRPSFKACVSSKFGEVDDCGNFNVEDKPLHICMEESSNKLKVCNDDENIYLCFQHPEHSVSKHNSFMQCSDEMRHACVSKEGFLHYCSLSGLDRIERSAFDNDYSTEELFWINYWMEWAHPHTNQTVKYPELSIKMLCFTEINDLVECYGGNAGKRACISATGSYIGRCKELSDSEKAVPLCMERHSEKLLTCGKFPRAYLCYPPDGHLQPKFPCHDDSRHVCYTDGFVQNCHIAEYYKARRENHRIRRETIGLPRHALHPHTNSKAAAFSENQIVGELRNDTKPTHNDFVHLCELSNMKFGECNRSVIERKLCVNLNLQKIEVCSDKENMTSVPICINVSTDRIITCEPATPLFLCKNSEENYSVKQLCNSSYNYLCLNETGDFGNCENLTKLSQNATESHIRLDALEKRLKVLEERFGFLENETMLIEEVPFEILCITYDGQFIRCVDDPYLSVACLSARNWTLQTCEEVERNSELGIPVCVQSNTSKLMTCESHSQDFICYSSDNITTKLKSCELNSSTVCVTDDGVLIDCSQIIYAPYTNTQNNTEEIKPFNLEEHFLGIESLCFRNNSKDLTPCSYDQNESSACLYSTNGMIGPCNETKPYWMPIQICREVQSKAVITCGKFNKVNLCAQEDNSTSYFPCATTHLFVCLDNGKTSKCILQMTTKETTTFVRSNDTSDHETKKDIERNETDVSNYNLFNSNATRKMSKRSINRFVMSKARKQIEDDEFSKSVFNDDIANENNIDYLKYDTFLTKYDEDEWEYKNSDTEVNNYTYSKERNYYYDDDDYDDDEYFYNNDVYSNYYYEDDYRYDDEQEHDWLSTKRKFNATDSTSKVNTNFSIYDYICSHSNSTECSQNGSEMIEENNFSDADKPVETALNFDNQKLKDISKVTPEPFKTTHVKVLSFTNNKHETDVNSFITGAESVKNEDITDKDIKFKTYQKYNIGSEKNTNSRKSSRNGSEIIDNNNVTDAYQPVGHVLNSKNQKIKNYFKTTSKILKSKPIKVLRFTNRIETDVPSVVSDVEIVKTEDITTKHLKRNTHTENNIGSEKEISRRKRSETSAITVLRPGDIYTNETPKKKMGAKTSPNEKLDARAPPKKKMDEKFIRITCEECNVDNSFVIVGTPEDVLPEVEVITFKP